MKILQKAIAFISLVLFSMLVPMHVWAQDRFLVGPSFGIDSANTSLGISAAVEAPFLKHYELDLQDTFSPLESHSGYGRGTANIARVGGIAWVTKSIGVTASGEYSSYHVTSLHKGAYYAFVGPVFRFSLMDAPTRVSIEYTRQFQNGVDKNGIETSREQGVRASLSSRIGCAGPFCYRIEESFGISRYLTQGNPVCDGAIGPTICPRGSGVMGDFEAGFAFEFPRRKKTENDVF